MSEKDNLRDFKEIKLNVQEKFKDIIGEPKEFPKYTTQIINIANQNSQGTRPEVVGQMHEIAHKKFKEKFGGAVFFVFSVKSGDKKVIHNKEIIDEIKTEIKRLQK